MDGLFLEIGPLQLKDGSVTINPYSWHNVANMLFIDQPVGTGMSYTKDRSGYAKNDDAINLHFYNFLISFFKLYDQFITNVNGKKVSRKLFITGESHAGHYIPTISAFIRRKNKEISFRNLKDEIIIDLVGIALGITSCLLIIVCSLH
jgi:carboxypeptidase D